MDIFTSFATISVPLVATLSTIYAIEKQQRKRWHYKIKNDFMDPTIDHHLIIKNLLEHDMPFMTRASLELGQFRTFAIPSISKLLNSTGEYTKQCPIRYDDTDLILREILENGVHSRRAEAAIARLNEIHGKYPSITNDDFLYTLSIFIVIPVIFIDKFGYRKVSKNEREALFQSFRIIGNQMHIEHIPKSYDATVIFHHEYERKYMKFSTTNFNVGTATMDFFLEHSLPRFLRPIGRQFAICLLDERLRAALGIGPRPNLIISTAVSLIMFFRSVFVLRFMVASEYSRRRTPSKATCPYLTRWDPFDYASYPRGYNLEDLGPKKKGIAAKKSQ